LDNFNDRVRKVPKIYYLNVWNVPDPTRKNKITTAEKTNKTSYY
jgi:hypothetical protein